MPADKSVFYYGGTYHRLFDPPLAAARRLALDLVPPHSRVLDLACGTGQLCLALRSAKSCHVTGLDLSLRMLRFATRTNPFNDVSFLHGDATDLVGIADAAFDYATVLFLLHELPRDRRVRVISEGLRVARHLLLIDARSPLPRNAEGLAIRLVEATFGHEHFHHFRHFLALGGIMSAVQDAGQAVTVEHRSVFLHACREAIMLRKNGTATEPALEAGRPCRFTKEGFFCARDEFLGPFTQRCCWSAETGGIRANPLGNTMQAWRRQS